MTHIILEKNNRDDSAGLGRLVSLDEEISLEELVSKIKGALNIS